MSNYSTYCTRCVDCSGITTKSYAKTHEGKCKACATGTTPQEPDTDPRSARIIDSGWSAYAREEGHYDY